MEPSPFILIKRKNDITKKKKYYIGLIEKLVGNRVNMTTYS